MHAANGYRSAQTLEEQRQLLAAEAEATSNLRAALEKRAQKLSGTELDPDMLEEQVRKQLGFTHPDEIVLFLE